MAKKIRKPTRRNPETRAEGIANLRKTMSAYKKRKAAAKKRKGSRGGQSGGGGDSK